MSEGRQEFLQKIRNRLHHYCSIRERSSAELREKAFSLELTEPEVEGIVKDFMELRIVDDERFASIYVRSKFIGNKWGKLKIKQGLRIKLKSPSIIDRALAELDDEEYAATIRHLIESKMSRSRKKGLQKKAQIVSYLRSKGFEDSAIWTEINTYQDNEW
jgi:regulatory protein